MLGIGFRFALVVVMRGTPWMTRGSFIRAGSSLAGTVSLRAHGQLLSLRIRGVRGEGVDILLVTIDR